jgi:N-acetyl-gamma-glutamyl-phosphate reductase
MHELFAGVRVIDLSADFRLSPEAYAKWYGHEHHAPELQQEAVYGLVEVYRRQIKKARLVANPGCYTTCAQLPLIPLLKAKAIDPNEIVVDAKSGMTGAGRSAKEAMLFSEVSEGFNAYGVGHHRHMAELDQEFTKAAGREVIVSFTPHLVPMNRGILSTIYVRGRKRTAEELHAILAETYAKEPFVHVLPYGELLRRELSAVRHDAERPVLPAPDPDRDGLGIEPCVVALGEERHQREPWARYARRLAKIRNLEQAR